MYISTKFDKKSLKFAGLWEAGILEFALKVTFKKKWDGRKNYIPVFLCSQKICVLSQCYCVPLRNLFTQYSFCLFLVWWVTVSQGNVKFWREHIIGKIIFHFSSPCPFRHAVYRLTLFLVAEFICTSLALGFKIWSLHHELLHTDNNQIFTFIPYVHL